MMGFAWGEWERTSHQGSQFSVLGNKVSELDKVGRGESLEGLGKLPDLSEPHFLHMLNETNNIHLSWLPWELNNLGNCKA